MLATLLGSSPILALPAAFIGGSTSVAFNMHSVRLGKGQQRQLFGLLGLSMMFNPLVDYIFVAFTSPLWGSSWAGLALVLGVLSMGPATAYFQVNASSNFVPLAMIRVVELSCFRGLSVQNRPWDAGRSISIRQLARTTTQRK